MLAAYLIKVLETLGKTLFMSERFQVNFSKLKQSSNLKLRSAKWFSSVEQKLLFSFSLIRSCSFGILFNGLVASKLLGNSAFSQIQSIEAF